MAERYLGPRRAVEQPTSESGWKGFGMAALFNGILENAHRGRARENASRKAVEIMSFPRPWPSAIPFELDEEFSESKT